MNYRKLTLDFSPPDGASPEATYTLKVLAATADPAVASPSWTLHLRELHRWAKPIALTVREGKEKAVVLYPDHTAKLALRLAQAPPALPEGASWLADVTLQDAEDATFQLPLELRLEADHS
jgi:hypothetical protein